MRAKTEQLVEALLAAHPTILRRDADTYVTEPRGRYRGDGVVLAPSCVEEVSAIMKACFEARMPVVPYGGGTGLVGGQIMDAVPIILSLERMNAIRDVDPVANTAEVEAGAVLDMIREAAAEQDRLFPLALGSSGSARIGGLLATNAGGVNVLRYGMARALCLGVEAVLADGRIYRGLGGLRKDNTGYDLRDLLIGSEGTLGVITAATLRLSPRPAREATALLAVPSPKAALALLSMAQSRFGDTVSAFELISKQGLDFMTQTGVPFRCPLVDVPQWMVLIELGVSVDQDPVAGLEELFSAAFEADHCTDGVIAQSEAQRAEIWHMREHIPEGNRLIGSISSHDISVPISRIPEFIEAGIAALGPEIRVNCFGHLGDGNLHYNAFPAEGRDRSEYDQAQVQRIVHDLVAEFGGSISAEHGIGRLKARDLERYADPVKMDMMRAIKQALDPRGILNPGVILPDHSPS